MKWEEYLQRVAEAEREYVRGPGCAPMLREMSPLEMMDAAHEDPQGRMPYEPGYDTGGEVIELPAREPEPAEREAPIVGDIFAALRELGRRASRGR